MGLFDPSLLHRNTEELSPVHRMEGDSLHRLGAPGKRVADVIGPIEPGKIIHYKTKGKWSTHQVLAYLLSVSGPAEVHLSTYTASEDPIRFIVQSLQQGLITDLHCIFDYRIRTYNAAAFQLIQANCSNIGLVKNHSKVLVVQNEKWQLTAITSSNLNNNARVEVGVLFTDPETAQFHRNWIKEEIDGANQRTAK